MLAVVVLAEKKNEYTGFAFPNGVDYKDGQGEGSTVCLEAKDRLGCLKCCGQKEFMTMTFDNQGNVCQCNPNLQSQKEGASVMHQYMARSDRWW